MRVALDERAAALNRAIDEFRTLDRALQKQGRARRTRTPLGGTDVLGSAGTSTMASALKASRVDGGGAVTARSSSGGAGAANAEEADVIRHWSQFLGHNVASPHSHAAARLSPREERFRSHSPVSRRGRASREAVDQHLNWLYNFSREAAHARPLSARTSRHAYAGSGGRLTGFY